MLGICAGALSDWNGRPTPWNSPIRSSSLWMPGVEHLVGRVVLDLDHHALAPGAEVRRQAAERLLAITSISVSDGALSGRQRADRQGAGSSVMGTNIGGRPNLVPCARLTPLSARWRVAHGARYRDCSRRRCAPLGAVAPGAAQSTGERPVDTRRLGAGQAFTGADQSAGPSGLSLPPVLSLALSPCPTGSIIRGRGGAPLPPAG